MQNYKNLLLTVVCLIAGFVSLHFKVMVVAIPAAIATLYFFVCAVREQNKEAAAGNQKIKDTDKQLRTELVAVQNLAIVKLATADQSLRTQVVDLLVEAGSHLGHPYTNSRLVYGADYFVKWNTDGLALVEQAKQLIESYKPVNVDRGGGELH